MNTKPVTNELHYVYFSAAKKGALLCSFSFYKALVIIIFAEAFLFPTFGLEDVFALETQIIFYALCALVCVATAMFLRRNTILFIQDWYLGLALTLSLSGLFFLNLYANANIQDHFSAYLCFYLGVGFLGLGFMSIHIEFGRLFGYLGMSKTLVFGVLSSCIGACLYLVTCFMGAPLRWFTIALFFVVTVLFFYRVRSALEEFRITTHKHEKELKLPCRFMLTSLMQGVGFGFLYGMLSISQNTSYPLILLIGFLGAALLTTLTLLIFPVDFNRSIYHIGFPLVALGMLGVGLFFSEPFPFVGLHVIGFLYLDLVLWALGSYLIKDCDQPATWVVACPCAMLMLGRATGAFAGELIPQNIQPTALLVGSTVIILAALLLSSERNMRTGWGFIRPGDSQSATDLAKLYAVTAKEHQLTPRELEVLKPLMEGHDSDEIAKALHISPNTVKSHIQSIYRKFGVHSRKELLRLIKNHLRLLQERSTELSS